MVFLHETTYKYSLEAPHQGASNKYTQHKSLLRDKNNIYLYTPRAIKIYVSFKKFCDNDVISKWIPEHMFYNKNISIFLLQK